MTRWQGWDLAEGLERLIVNAEVQSGFVPVSSDTVEYEGRQMKQCWIQCIEIFLKKVSKKQYTNF